MQNSGKTPGARRRASTGDVLGLVILDKPKVQRKWNEHHTKLIELRERLRGEKSARTESAKHTVPNFSEHMADAATDTYDRDWALAALSSTQNALYEIDEALNRIYSGSYGKCELTGMPIEPERLKAIPWTRFSASAQTQVEAKGQGARFRLGVLGSYQEMGAVTEPDEDLDDTPAAEQREAA